MSLKRKEMLAAQKAYHEQMLKDRLAVMAEKGIKPPQTDKDPLVRKLKAEVKATDRRLRSIADGEKRIDDAAKAKAAAAAAAKAPKEEGRKAEKPKKEGGEGKEKKPKPEKKAPKPKEAKETAAPAPKPEASPAEPAKS